MLADMTRNRKFTDVLRSPSDDNFVISSFATTTTRLHSDGDDRDRIGVTVELHRLIEGWICSSNEKMEGGRWGGVNRRRGTLVNIISSGHHYQLIHWQSRVGGSFCGTVNRSFKLGLYYRTLFCNLKFILCSHCWWIIVMHDSIDCDLWVDWTDRYLETGSISHSFILIKRKFIEKINFPPGACTYFHYFNISAFPDRPSF